MVRKLAIAAALVLAGASLSAQRDPSKHQVRFKRGAPDARIVYFPTAGHFIYMTREAEVLREIHAFVAALPAVK